MDLEKTAPHVFVVGFPRTGTTLVKRIVESHPSFIVKKNGNPENTMFFTPETHIFEMLYQYKQVSCSWERNVIDFFNSPKEFDRFLKKLNFLISLQKISPVRLLKYRYVYLLQKAIGNNIISHSIRIWHYVLSLNYFIINSYFDCVSSVRNGQRIVEKTPHHYQYLSEIFYSFPDTKIIFAIRHPVDVYSSFKKRAMVDPESWLDVHLSSFCKQYNECYQSMFWFLKKYPDNIFLLNYETFVNDPESGFKKLCNFLGEPYDRDCILGDESIKGPAWDPYVHKDVMKQTKKWNDYLSKRDAEEIENRLEKIMGRLNYKRYTESG